MSSVAPSTVPSSASTADQELATRVRAAVEQVLDPELPLITIADLGILRGVDLLSDGDGLIVSVTITPTYSGCPAMETIRADIESAVREAGVQRVDVRTQLAPAWSTDDMSDAAHVKLAAAGIAPPSPVRDVTGPVSLTLSVRCPHCGSPRTRETSRFGSTACKSLWVCQECREPFDSVKPL